MNGSLYRPPVKLVPRAVDQGSWASAVALTHAGPAAVQSRKWVLDAALLVAFLAEAVVAKSRFGSVVGGWYGHMVLTVAFVAILSIRGLGARIVQLPALFPPRPVNVLLGATLCWAVVCCLVQPNVFANVVYLMVFALNIYVCLYVAPGLLLPYLHHRSVMIYGALLFLINLVNVGSAFGGGGGAYFGGRLRGVLADPLHTGTMGWVASIVALWAILQRRDKRCHLWAAWLVATCVLIMTRTRSYMFGCAIGSLALIAISVRQPTVLGKRARRLMVLLLLSAIILADFVSRNPDMVPQVRGYLRVAGDAEEILEARMVHWQLGVLHVKTYPVFGRGPMAKFGNVTDPTVNTYDMLSCFDNTWLTMAQSYGIPGSALFAASVLTMLTLALRGYGVIPLLAVGVLAAGIGTSFSSMWAVSFGTGGDRAMWLILGLAVATPRAQRFPRMYSSDQTMRTGGCHA